jgi:hypothetical protein
MKQQGNNSPAKSNNSKINASNSSEEEEISTNEFQKAMLKTMNELKKEMYKL